MLTTLKQAQPVPPAASGEVTDGEIEAQFLKCGGKWNGDVWTLEDADLHPFVRTVIAATSAKPSQSEQPATITWNAEGVRTVNGIPDYASQPVPPAEITSIAVEDLQSSGSVVMDAYYSMQDASRAARRVPPAERNFCERCGKRLSDSEYIHTCTPPESKV